ncbi:hypothetical protein MPSEU_001100600 [Mayamaea pseudoterrestris]|nr:hypothetical protein MPSEU_001100600 [Mayamaea pseudoterrestris]
MLSASLVKAAFVTCRRTPIAFSVLQHSRHSIREMTSETNASKRRNRRKKGSKDAFNNPSLSDENDTHMDESRYDAPRPQYSSHQEQGNLTSRQNSLSYILADIWTRKSTPASIHPQMTSLLKDLRITGEQPMEADDVSTLPQDHINNQPVSLPAETSGNTKRSRRKKNIDLSQVALDESLENADKLFVEERSADDNASAISISESDHEQGERISFEEEEEGAENVPRRRPWWMSSSASF